MNRVRITSGQFGSRFIKTLPDLRPTSELVRKAIFDILGNQIEDARFLDLFAGSGSVGFEALSRGAKQATFIDNQSAHHQLLKSNAKTLAVEDLAIIRKMDVAAFLEANQTPYDIIFADPWYKDRLDISNWNRPELLTPHGLVIVEHDPKTEPTHGDGFRILNRKRYGDTALTFYTPV
jgi:16S rRNA (guanine966-N2)-methyltransferase